MKNYKIYTAILLLTLFAVSCKKDYLERTPGVALSEDEIFADPAQAARFADNAYNYVINKYVRFNDHRGCVAQASDEAVSGNSEGTVTTLNRGLYHDHSNGASLNDIYDIWKRMYAGIAIETKMLSRLADVPPAPPATVPIFQPVRVEGEMRFLRAMSYFELTKRFGGVPIVDKVYTVNDELNLPRNSFDEVTKYILADLAIAENKLGNDADYTTADYGRPTKGAVQALRTRVLLYAASPLNNPTGDKSKWAAAAAAAQRLMNGEFGAYALQASYGDILNVPTSSEYIMIRIKGNTPLAGEMMQDFSMSPGSGGAQGQMNPTQNHVDMYEMANGKAISDPTSGYDPQKPYANREPRFYDNIIYNDRPWQGRAIQMWSSPAGALDYSTTITYTATRYYCKKYWPEVYRTVGGSTTLLNYIYFRYAEVLLNYAEAQNEAVGPGDINGSVYAQLIAIRKRGGILAGADNLYGLKANMTQDEMRTVIRHERAIELAFEDHRWYDIMRWKIGATTIGVPMKGMDVIKQANGSFTYTPFVLSQTFQKTWTEKQNLYPIPRAEIYKSKGVLTQNPGWE
ncbi:RagB/SusD family nutrient uptake outer membrane protein [Pedobacter sp. HDW13]|uniref:RagB/SusD family nutrient uptake outer membrane protein n=1 Tax=unclassified Pedobacter TaxID=2628915 RepID=UPI000F5A7638|nr:MULTISPECIES: RagB/SusD family nutrient uptake outer membrane protein [unclassified Pedobacter]QIL41593.1 RagB/SusD family nutrient uptake outer membrane protein [Pedobacter sp. HDW13]RQO77831.1 RagB/SusD family nutrient uptake outer membrane protein [Pedobacter sp. KBW01]